MPASGQNDERINTGMEVKKDNEIKDINFCNEVDK